MLLVLLLLSNTCLRELKWLADLHRTCLEKPVQNTRSGIHSTSCIQCNYPEKKLWWTPAKTKPMRPTCCRRLAARAICAMVCLVYLSATLSPSFGGREQHYQAKQCLTSTQSGTASTIPWTSRRSKPWTHRKPKTEDNRACSCCRAESRACFGNVEVGGSEVAAMVPSLEGCQFVTDHVQVDSQGIGYYEMFEAMEVAHVSDVRRAKTCSKRWRARASRNASSSLFQDTWPAPG